MKKQITQADQNREGHITYDKWVRFAIKYPGVVDALFFRSRDLAPSGTYSTTYSDPTSIQRARESQLRGYYNETWQGSVERQRASDDYSNAKREADAARMQKELAESRERRAWDKLHYSPSSPRYY